MFESKEVPTFLWLCAEEWHCIGYGVCDALDGKTIGFDAFEDNLKEYPESEKAGARSRYHYYRASGSIVSYLRSHWGGIAIFGAAIAAQLLNMKFNFVKMG